MKKFYLIVVTVFATFNLVVVFLEIEFKNYKTNIDYLFDRINKCSDSTTLILTGNSHIGALGNFIQNDSIKSLNLSIGGQDIFHQYLLIKKAVQESPHLKIAIVGIDYDLLGYDFVISDQMNIDRQYFKHTDTMYEYSLATILMAKSNFFRSNRDLSYLFYERENKICVADNFIPLVSNVFSEDDCRKRAKEHTLIKFDKDLIPANVQVLGKIYYLLKSKNIEMIVLVTPKTSCYRKYSDSANVALGKAALYSFFKDKNLIYLDLYGDEDFESDDFLDFDHLSKSGKNKLFTKLNDYLKLNK